MSSILFQAIDQTNEEAVKSLRIKKEQEEFIESVADCLKEAEEVEEWQTVAIYFDDRLVGFAMYGSFGPNRDTWIDRIIIDQAYQGKGIGRAAMLALIDRVSKLYDVQTIYLSIIETNHAAHYLYKSIGFSYINEKDPNGELIFKYTKLE